MPLIAYPEVNIGRHPDDAADTLWTLPVERTELVLDTPGRVVHESPETRDAIVVNRGPSLWFLTLTFGAVEANTPLHREFEQWLARMHDLRNYAAVPLGSRAYGGTLTNAGLTVSGKSGTTMTLSAPMLVAANTPPPTGVYLRIQNRLAMLESVNAAGTEIATTPNVGAVGDAVSLAETALVRLAGDGRYRALTSGGLTEPLTVPFQEALI